MKPLYLVVCCFFALQVAVICAAINGPFTDEGLYILAGYEMLEADFTGGYQSWFGGSPFLFPILARVGYAFGGLDGSRVVAALCSTLALYLFGLFAAALFGRRPALFATLGLALNGTFFSFAHLAVYDSLAFVGLTGCLWTAAEFAKSGRRRWLWSTALFAALGVASKYSTGLLYFVPIALGWAVGGRRAATAIVGALSAAGLLTLAYLKLAHGQFLPLDAARVLSEHASIMSRGEVLFKIVFLLIVPLLLALLGARMLGGDQRKLSVALFVGSLIWPAMHLAAAQHVSLHKDTTYGFFFLYPLAGVWLDRLWRDNWAVFTPVASVIATWAVVQAYLEDHSWIDVRPAMHFVAPRLVDHPFLLVHDGFPYAMYAKVERFVRNARFVKSAWDVPNLAGTECASDWVVLREGQQPQARQFAEYAERCGLTPVGAFDVSSYYIAFPLAHRALDKLVVYGRELTQKKEGK